MRRSFLKTIPAALCAAVAGPAILTSRNTWADAEKWPTKPIRLSVPALPGGGSDMVARLLSQAISDDLGQSVVVENRPGASGTLAVSTGLTAPADGYTFIWCIPSSQIIPPPNVRYDVVNDLMPVGLTVSASFLVVVAADSPYATLRDLVDAAKANPGRYNYGSSGTGTYGHLAGAYFSIATGTEFTHIPYTSEAPVVVSIIGGDLQMSLISSAVALPQVRGGKLRALAVSSGERMEGIPADIPLVAEFAPGFDMVTFNYISARTGTPQPIIDRMNQSIRTALADPTIRERILSLGLEPGGGTPEALGERITAERAKLTGLMQQAGITLE